RRTCTRWSARRTWETSIPCIGRKRSVFDEREELRAVEPLASAEERQLDDEAGADDDAAQLLDELADRLDRPAGREHVVVDDDASSLRNQLRVQLEDVLAVLEHVASADRFRRQLAGSPRGDEADTCLGRDRRADPEAACLGAEHEVGL